MKKKSILNFVSTGVLVLVMGAFVFNLPFPTTSPAKSMQAGESDLHLIGILDPDGRKHIWALPADAAAGISRRLAAKYPRQSIEGVIFYRVRSWRDTANIVIEAHAQQGVLIVDLISQVERLKQSGPDRQLTRRVDALEELVTSISYGGNP